MGERRRQGSLLLRMMSSAISIASFVENTLRGLYGLWYGASFRLRCELGHMVPRLRFRRLTLWSSLKRSEEAALESYGWCSTGGSVGTYTRVCSSNNGARVSGPHSNLAVRPTTIPHRESGPAHVREMYASCNREEEKGKGRCRSRDAT
jgi:hypothetical protein